MMKKRNRIRKKKRCIWTIAILPAIFGFLLNGCEFNIPPTPRGVKASAMSTHEIKVSWYLSFIEELLFGGCDTDERICYNVYRGQNRIAHTCRKYYNDGSLSPDTKYCYQVTSECGDSFFSFSESSKSKKVRATTFASNTLSGSNFLGDAGMHGTMIELIAVYPDQCIYSTSTDSNGNYSFSDIGTGLYFVVPSGPGYIFSPTIFPVVVHDADASSLDFIALPDDEQP